MIIICYGMIKSASTYAFQVTEEIVKQDCENKGLQFYKPSQLIDSLEYDFLDRTVDLDNIIDALKNSECDFNGEHHIVFKTHMERDFLLPLINAFNVKVIASFRHPAEIALSLVDVAKKEKLEGKNRFASYDTLSLALEQLPYQIGCFYSWLDSEDFCTFTLNYDLVASFDNVLFESLAEYLSVDCNISKILTFFNENSNRIVEFNKGVKGRRYSELPTVKLIEIEKNYPEICKLVNNS